MSMKKSLKSSIFLVTFSLALLPMIAVGLSMLVKIQGDAKKSAETMIMSRLDEAIDRMNHELDLISARTIVLGRDKDITLGARSLLLRYQAAEMIEVFFKENRVIGKIGILSTDEEFVVAEPKALSVLNVSPLSPELKNVRDLFSVNDKLSHVTSFIDVDVIKDELRFLEPNRANPSSMAAVITVPLMEDVVTGDVAGLLVCIIPIDNLVSVAKPKIADVLNLSVKLMDRRQASAITKVQMNSDQVRVASLWDPPQVRSLQKDSFVIEVTESYRKYSSVLYNALLDSALLFFLSLIIVFVATLYFARLLTKPLEKISKSVDAYAFGNFDHRSDNLVYTELDEIEQTLSNMGSQIKARINALEEKARMEVELRMTKDRAQLAAQVAHDIRSPVAALDAILHSLSEVPEAKRSIMRRGVNRITEIANELLQSRGRATASASESYVTEEDKLSGLDELLQELIVEKQYYMAQFPNVKLALHERPHPELMVSVARKDLLRVLSNIINNGVEAMKHGGEIGISCFEQDDAINLYIEDSGCGIPAEVCEHIFKEGFSHGKSEGSGLGLYDAVLKIRSWGGTFSILSQEGRGTLVSIQIPLAKKPSWYVDRIELSSAGELIVVDDDMSIHDFWRSSLTRYENLYGPVRIRHFMQPKSFSPFAMEVLRDERNVFVIDFEFEGSDDNGLQLIERYGLQNRAYLVTGRAGDSELIRLCKEKGVKLVSKTRLSTLQISLRSNDQKRFVVLLDDDVWLRDAWLGRAHALGLAFLAFEDAHSLEQYLPGISKDSVFFIDSELGSVQKGEEFAKFLNNSGFKHTYLCTGKGPDQFPAMPWVIDILGKEFPEALIKKIFSHGA